MKNSFELDELVPLPNPVIKTYSMAESSSYLLHDENVNLEVNEITVVVLRLVNGVNSLREISNLMSQQHSINIEPVELFKILHGRLAKYNVVSFREYQTQHWQPKSDLKFQMTIFPAAVVFKVARRLTFLFDVRVFIIMLILGLCILALPTKTVNLKQLGESVSPAAFILLAIMFNVSSIFHELGHAAACFHFGGRPGRIGFAFLYFVFPVWFANVSEIWRLPRYHRLVVNVSGIYFDLLLAVLFLISYHLTLRPLLYSFSFVLLMKVIYNLNPLMKFDGYWVLTDLLNIKNLGANSKRASVNLFRKPSLSQIRNLTLPSTVLLLYFVLSSTWLISLAVSATITSIRFATAVASESKASNFLSTTQNMFYNNPTGVICCFVFVILIVKWIIRQLRD